MPRRDARMGGLRTMKSTPARLRASADAHTLTSPWQSVLDLSAFCNRGECSHDGSIMSRQQSSLQAKQAPEPPRVGCSGPRTLRLADAADHDLGLGVRLVAQVVDALHHGDARVGVALEARVLAGALRDGCF